MVWVPGTCKRGKGGRVRSTQTTQVLVLSRMNSVVRRNGESSVAEINNCHQAEGRPSLERQHHFPKTHIVYKVIKTFIWLHIRRAGDLVGQRKISRKRRKKRRGRSGRTKWGGEEK